MAKSGFYMTLLLLVLMIFGTGRANLLSGQMNAPLTSDRPGQAFSANTVGKLVFQLQTGLDQGFARFALGTDGERARLYTLKNNSFVRFGITKSLEANLQLDTQYDRLRVTDTSIYTSQGLSNCQVGLRMNLIAEAKGWIPALGIQARTSLPINSPSYKTLKFGPEFGVFTSHALPGGMSFSTNWLVSWDGRSDMPIWGYVANFGFPIAPRLNGFVESYGSVQNGTFINHFDGGLGFLVNDNLQLDLFGGTGKNNGVNESFISLGVTWRTGKKEPN